MEEKLVRMSPSLSAALFCIVKEQNQRLQEDHVAQNLANFVDLSDMIMVQARYTNA